MKTYTDMREIFANNKVLCYCEDRGIYEVYRRYGNTIEYYSYYDGEGFYKITKNVKTGTEKRTRLKYAINKPPKFLIDEKGGTKYNYCCG